MISDASLQNAEFDESEYLKRALHLPSVEGEQARLNRCIEHIQSQIRTVIAENTDPLLQQVDSAVDAERNVVLIRGSISSLTSSSRRLKHTIEEPFQQISSKLCEVRHSQQALECLRSVQRFLALVSKLPELLVSDVARAARSLRDLEDLLANGQLSGIHVVDRHLDTVTRCSASIRSKAHELLKSALSTHNQTELAVALQCFFSLGTLARVATNIVAEHKREAVKLLVRELDPQAISNIATDGKTLCEITFAKLEASLSDIVHRNAAVTLLWKVITKRKDPTTQELFSTAFEGGAQQLVGDYWSAVSSQLQEKLAKLTKRANIHAMIVAQYQRWYIALKTFCRSSDELFSILGKSDMGDMWLGEMTKEIEEEFTTLSLEKLREKVQQISSRIGTAMPGSGAENIVMDLQVDLARPVIPAAVLSIDVKSLIKIISQEMSSHRQDQHILTIVMKNAVVSLQQLRQKVSDGVAKLPLPPMPSITGPPTAAQVFHLSMANACATLFGDISNIVGVLPAVESGEEAAQYSAAHTRLREVSNAFEAQTASILSPFFASAEHTLLKCVSSCSTETADATSVEQLQNRANHIASRFLLLVDRSTPTVEQLNRKLVSRLALRAQVRVLLVRPISEAQRIFLSTFLTNLPTILQHVGQIDNSARLQLRAVRATVASVDGHTWTDSLSHIHSLLSLLAAVQRVPMLDLGPIYSEPTEKFTDMIESVITDSADAAALWETVRRAVSSYESKPLTDEKDAALRSAVLRVCSACGSVLLTKKK